MSLRRAGSRQYPCHTPVVVPPERLNAPVSRAESVSGCSDSWLGSNPNSDANDHQRYEDHGHVDREPPGWLVLGLFGHGLVPLRTILQRGRLQVWTSSHALGNDCATKRPTGPRWVRSGLLTQWGANDGVHRSRFAVTKLRSGMSSV